MLFHYESCLTFCSLLYLPLSFPPPFFFFFFKKKKIFFLLGEYWRPKYQHFQWQLPKTPYKSSGPNYILNLSKYNIASTSFFRVQALLPDVTCSPACNVCGSQICNRLLPFIAKCKKLRCGVLYLFYLIYFSSFN